MDNLTQQAPSPNLPPPNLPPYAAPRPAPLTPPTETASPPSPATIPTAPLPPPPTTPPVNPPPIPPTSPVEPSFEEHHTFSPLKRRLITVAVVVVVGLGLGGITVAAAEMGFLPWLGIERLYGKTALAGLWGGIPADNLTALTLFASRPVKFPTSFTSTYTVEYAGSLKPAETKPQSTFAGKSSLATTAINRYESAEAKLAVQHTLEQADQDKPTDIFLETELILRDKTVYLQVPEKISSDLLSSIGIPVELAGKYYKFKIDEESWDNFQTELDKADTIGLNSVKTSLSEEQLTTLMKKIAPYITRRGIERKNGRSATHYSISLDKEKITKLATEIIAIFDDETSNLPFTDQDVADLNKGVANFDLDYEFWIERGTYMITESNISLSLETPQIILDGGLNTVSQSINPSSVTIEAPADSLVVDNLTSTSLAPTDAAARDATRQADLVNWGSLLDGYHAEKGTYPLTTTAVSLDSYQLPSEISSTLPPKNGPNGSDDDYFYQTDATGSTYLLTATLENCPESGCVYTYPENSTLTTVDQLSTALGRDTQRKTDLSTIASALKAYYTEHKAWPSASGVIKLNDPGNTLEQALVKKGYLQSLPLDPTSDSYYYGYRTSGKNALLTSIIEDSSQTTCTQTGSFCVYTVTVTP